MHPTFAVGEQCTRTIIHPTFTVGEQCTRTIICCFSFFPDNASLYPLPVDKGNNGGSLPPKDSPLVEGPTRFH